jgi:thiamine-phosphate pyrophosphorylase
LVAAVIHGFYGVVDLGAVGTPTEACALAEKLCAGGASILQLRMKKSPAQGILECARALRVLTRARGVPFCVNDRLDIALVCGADVVHLGQEDLPLAAARAIAAGRLAIGISTHSEEQAREALRGGADYLGFGPVFATRTKENPDPTQGVAALAAVVALAKEVPVVAIGGITIETAPEVARAGAKAACVIAAVNFADDPALVARRIASSFGSKQSPAPCSVAPRG